MFKFQKYHIQLHSNILGVSSSTEILKNQFFPRISMGFQDFNRIFQYSSYFRSYSRFSVVVVGQLYRFDLFRFSRHDVSSSNRSKSKWNRVCLSYDTILKSIRFYHSTIYMPKMRTSVPMTDLMPLYIENTSKFFKIP